MVFSFPIKTRYVETAQDGIIHHSSYVIYYETARIEFLKHKGFDINEMEKQSILSPVVSLDAQYLKPLRSLEQIKVQVSVHSCSRVRFQILHEIYKGEEKMAFAITTHCFINAAFRPISIPAELLQSFRKDVELKKDMP